MKLNPIAGTLRTSSIMLAAVAGIGFLINVGFAAGTCASAPSGLVGWWRGEGSANDTIGGRDGMLYNGTAFGAGAVGQAFSFDGVNDSVVNSAGGIKSATNSFTIEFWARPNASRASTPEGTSGITGTGGQRYAIYPDFGDLGPVGVGVSVGTNGISVFEHGYAYLASLLVYDSPIMAWTHIAVVYTDRHPSLYVNGALVRTGLTSTRIPYPSVVFGEAGPNSGNYGYYSGLLDEISIYNRPLGGGEIQAIFAASNLGKCVTPMISTNCAALPSGAVSWWKAESNAVDSVDGNHGVLEGNVTFGPGRAGNAFVLDGNRDGVRVGTATNLQLQNFTIEGWIKRTSLTTLSFNGNGGAELFALGAGGEGVGFYVRPDGKLALGKLQINEVSSNITISDTNWHHVAVAKTNTAVVFYLDGAAYTALPYISGGFTYSGPGYIGAWLNPFGQVDNSFYGTIDELAVYSRGLTASEIQAIYNAGSTGKCSPPPPPIECSSAPKDMISFWQGNDNAMDSADGNNGVLINGAGFTTGKVGQSFSFDGVDDAILVPNQPNLNPAGSLSIEGWIFPTADNAGIILSKWGDEGDYANNRSYVFRMQGIRGLELGISDLAHQNDTTFHQFSVNNVITLGAWNHVAGVYDHATGVRSLYVNGVLVGQKTNSPISIYNSITRVTIGAWSRSSSTITGNFPGQVDELSIYARALTSLEIASIYTANSGGKCTPPPNQPPQALPQSVALLEDGTTNITLRATDANGDMLYYHLAVLPTNGTLSGVAPNLAYRPNPNFYGKDAFQFRVTDAQSASALALVSISVLPVNDPPVAQSQSVATDEDESLGITLGAFDADGDTLSYHLSAPAHGTLTGTPPNLTYVPNSNFRGPDSFNFRVADGVSTSAVATVSITVGPVNDAPVARIAVSPLTQVLGITNQVVIAAVCGDATVILDGSGSSDVEEDPLTFEWSEGTNWLGATAVITNQFPIGTHEITLRVNDRALDGVAHEIVEVVSPAQGLGIIILFIEESGLGRANERPLIASLKAAAASFDDCRLIPAVHQLEAFQNKVRVQVAPSNPELATRLIEATQQIIDAVLAAP